MPNPRLQRTGSASRSSPLSRQPVLTAMLGLILVDIVTTLLCWKNPSWASSFFLLNSFLVPLVLGWHLGRSRAPARAALAGAATGTSPLVLMLLTFAVSALNAWRQGGKTANDNLSSRFLGTVGAVSAVMLLGACFAAFLGGLGAVLGSYLGRRTLKDASA